MSQTRSRLRSLRNDAISRSASERGPGRRTLARPRQRVATGTGRATTGAGRAADRNATDHNATDLEEGIHATDRRTVRLVRRRATRFLPPPFLPRRIARLVRSRSFAVAIAIACALYLQTLAQRARADMVQWGTRSPAVVALHRIEPGHRIQSADIAIRMLPTTLLPTGVSTSVHALVGRIPTVPVVTGQILTPDLMADHEASPTALRIGRGRVGVTIEVGAARPALSVGSLVLVVASPDAEARSGTASVEGVVVTFDDRFVTVSVPEHRATTLANLLAGGPVYVALKGA